MLQGVAYGNPTGSGFFVGRENVMLSSEADEDVIFSLLYCGFMENAVIGMVR